MCSPEHADMRHRPTHGANLRQGMGSGKAARVEPCEVADWVNALCVRSPFDLQAQNAHQLTVLHESRQQRALIRDPQWATAIESSPDGSALCSSRFRHPTRTSSTKRRGGMRL